MIGETPPSPMTPENRKSSTRQMLIGIFALIVVLLTRYTPLAH